jgi:hypothetical protein
MTIFKADPDFDYSLERTCKTCDNHFSGRYCNRCGEKIIEKNDKSILHFFSHVFNAFTFIDNKFFRTLRLMLLRTGELSHHYINGRRVPYIRPVSMFFVANLLYFLFPVFDTFNTSLHVHMHQLPHSPIANTMVMKRIEKEDTTLEVFTMRYRQQSTNLAKLLLIVFVLLAALPLALLNLSKKMFFIDHLMVSLEVNSILVLVIHVVIPWMLLAVNPIIQHIGLSIEIIFQDAVYSLITMIFVIVIFYFVHRRVYANKPVLSIIKALMLIPFIFVALQSYRAMLFFVTMWTL